MKRQCPECFSEKTTTNGDWDIETGEPLDGWNECLECSHQWSFDRQQMAKVRKSK